MCIHVISKKKDLSDELSFFLLNFEPLFPSPDFILNRKATCKDCFNMSAINLSLIIRVLIMIIKMSPKRWFTHSFSECSLWATGPLKHFGQPPECNMQYMHYISIICGPFHYSLSIAYI